MLSAQHLNGVELASVKKRAHSGPDCTCTFRQEWGVESDKYNLLDLSNVCDGP